MRCYIFAKHVKLHCRILWGVFYQEQIIQSTKSENINLKERIKVLSASSESIKLQQNKNSIEIHDSNLQSEERQAFVLSKSPDIISMKNYQPEEKPSRIIKENMVTEEMNENGEQISKEMESKSDQMMKNFNFNSRKRQLSEPNRIPFVESETGNKTSVNPKQSLFGTQLVSNNNPKTNQNIDEKMELNHSETVERTSQEGIGKINLENFSSGIKSKTMNDVSEPLIMAEQKTDSYKLESGNNRVPLEKNDKDVGIVTRMIVDAVSNGEI